MKQYKVSWVEVHMAQAYIEAESEEEAIEKAIEGDYDENTFYTEYSHIPEEGESFHDVYEAEEDGE